MWTRMCTIHIYVCVSMPTNSHLVSIGLTVTLLGKWYRGDRNDEDDFIKHFQNCLLLAFVCIYSYLPSNGGWFG